MGTDNTSDSINTEKQQTISTQEKRVIGRPFLPGQSGNPAGRPKKGTALTDVMREMLEGNPDIKKAIMAKLLAGAAGGDLAFIREVLDRIDGKPNVTADIHNTGEVVVVPDEVYKKYGITHDTEDSGSK